MFKGVIDMKSIFVLELPLVVQPFQKHILDKRFEIGRNIYNSLLTMTYKRYKAMVARQDYRDALAELETNKAAAREKLKEFRNEYRLGEYHFNSDVKHMQHHFKENIDSNTAQAIASRLWRGYEKRLFGNGHKLHYKKVGEFNTLDGKSNKSGIRFKDEKIYWFGLEIPVEIDYKNFYETEALKNEIVYCRIVRKAIRCKYKYYVQLVMRGIPPRRADRTIGSGNVELEIDHQNLTVTKDNVTKVIELADRVEEIEAVSAVLQQKLERSRRATNPNNYNEDGTPKKNAKWVRSKRYVKTLMELKELHRKQAAIRKQQHEELANEVISMGDEFCVKKSITTNAKGSKAPGMFLDILDRKLKVYGKSLTRQISV
jgi:hypothetical protein